MNKPQVSLPLFLIITAHGETVTIRESSFPPPPLPLAHILMGHILRFWLTVLPSSCAADIALTGAPAVTGMAVATAINNTAMPPLAPDNRTPGEVQAVVFNKALDKALARILSLREEVKIALIVEIIGTKVRVAVSWMAVDATVNIVISRVSATIVEQLGVNQVSRS